MVAGFFADDPSHSAVPCADCHGGDPAAATRHDAHVGMTRDPSDGDAPACGTCHAPVVATHATGLHATVRGIRNAVLARTGGGVLGGAVASAVERHCTQCHASCGQCHVSVPTDLGGGLLAGHVVTKTPPMNLTCAPCHGARAGAEFRGMNAGIPADTHYRDQVMACTDCHKADEMHGAGAAEADDRYHVTGGPRCADCHPDDDAFKATPAHAQHRGGDGAGKVACQVCHSGTYKNCFECHVSTDATGATTYEVNADTHHASVMALKVGHNPGQDGLHPEAWVTVRHAPAAPDTFAYYGDGLLPAFGSRPTWHLATPHSIRRKTTQNADCASSCHGKRALFLAPDDLKSYEAGADAGVVVATPPGPGM